MVSEYQDVRDDPALRRGLYGLKELAGYLNLDQRRMLSRSTVARWAHSGLTSTEHHSRRPDYSFVDLVSMLVVRNLVGIGFSLQDVRDTEEYFRTRYDIEHPFVSVHLKTDGVDVFYQAAPAIAEQLTAANRWGQEVLKPAIVGALTGVSYELGVAAYWSPALGVVLDPGVQFGEPCITETRVTTSHVAELATSHNTTPVELARLFRVDEIAIQRALAFESKLAIAA